MDADNSPSRPPTSAQGGTVEPANRATVARERFQTPLAVTDQRPEPRDPFGAALDAKGKRMTVQKVEGEGHRGPARATAPERPVDASPARDEVPAVTNAGPTGPTARRPEAADAPLAAGIDAKAERAAQVARLEAALVERYVIDRAPLTVGDMTIGRTAYRFRADTSRVAFTESAFRLATDTNSPSVARSMVDVAQARHWRALRVSGHQDFRRSVWLEASVRGVKALGYEPSPSDLKALEKEREARLVNRIEPARDGAPAAAAAPAGKISARGGGGRKAVLAAIEAVLLAKGVPQKQREAVMTAAADNLAQRLRNGQSIRVKVYDPSAPSQRQAVVPTPEAQRHRERAAPAR